MPALAAKAGADADEACPVCKQSRYLNPKMTFKISPQCYHRMCDSCIDRIYGPGPAPCPVAGCNKTLRRNEFRKQTFDDLTIERECDLRRYVNGILNKREADFETLRDYNDYLQTKEDLTFNLIYNIDVPATRKQLAQFEADNKEDIAKNRAAERTERELIESREHDRRRRQEEAQEDLRRELAEERTARERESQSVAGALLSADGDPEEAVRAARERVTLKKSSAARTYKADSQRRQEALAELVARRAGDARTGPAGASGGSSGGLSFAGLKKAEVKAPTGPYDPHGGMKLDTVYYRLRNGGDYDHPSYEQTKNKVEIMAGGYDMREYFIRAMHDAHAGLGVILSKEKALG